MNVVDDDKFDKIRTTLKQHFNVHMDDVLAVEVRHYSLTYLQGCFNDDKIILGGRYEFLNHFCTLFNFNICYSEREAKALKQTYQMFNDNESFNKKVDEWVRKLDEIK